MDELIVLDIDATAEAQRARLRDDRASGGRVPDAAVLRRRRHARSIRPSASCRSAWRRWRSAAGHSRDPSSYPKIAEQVGRQSVVVVLDVKKTLFGRLPRLHEQRQDGYGRAPRSNAPGISSVCGAGEIVLNSIDLDGAMTGYDLALGPRSEICGPCTDHDSRWRRIVRRPDRQRSQSSGIVGLAAGSLFVFKGPYRAVLISYLSSRPACLASGRPGG